MSACVDDGEYEEEGKEEEDEEDAEDAEGADEEARLTWLVQTRDQQEPTTSSGTPRRKGAQEGGGATMMTTVAVTGTATGTVTGETETVIETATARDGVEVAAGGDGWRLRKREGKRMCQVFVRLSHLLLLVLLPSVLSSVRMLVCLNGRRRCMWPHGTCQVYAPFMYVSLRVCACACVHVRARA